MQAKRIVIKKYAIHIMAVPGIGPDLIEKPVSRNAVIVCTHRDNRMIPECFDRDKRLIIGFPDYEDSRLAGAFNGAHARKIISFLDSLPECVTDLYICCSKGGSRSPAIAAALLRASGRIDDCIWKNPYYVPNKLVYYRMCRELKVSVSLFRVRVLAYINNQAYRRALHGGKCRYERWEIIE